MKEEYILDIHEIELSKPGRDYWSQIIGCVFVFSILIMLFTVAIFSLSGELAFYLPKNKIVESLAPKFMIDLKNHFEIRFNIAPIGGCILFYFFIMSFFNFALWREDSKKQLRILHALITIGLPFIFFLTMIEDEILHDTRINNPIGKQQFLNQAKIFHLLFCTWIIAQFALIKVFLNEKFRLKQ